jgi:hypothetical protein
MTAVIPEMITEAEKSPTDRVYVYHVQFQVFEHWVTSRYCATLLAAESRAYFLLAEGLTVRIIKE